MAGLSWASRWAASSRFSSAESVVLLGIQLRLLGGQLGVRGVLFSLLRDLRDVRRVAQPAEHEIDAAHGEAVGEREEKAEQDAERKAQPVAAQVRAAEAQDLEGVFHRETPRLAKRPASASAKSGTRHLIARRVRTDSSWLHRRFGHTIRFPAMADFPAPQKILVTGAAGFIGSRVCALLAQEGREVAALRQLQRRLRRAAQGLALGAAAKKCKGLELRRLDLCDTAGAEGAFRESRRAASRPAGRSTR